jgi:hypothetical protein
MPYHHWRVVEGSIMFNVNVRSTYSGGGDMYQDLIAGRTRIWKILELQVVDTAGGLDESSHYLHLNSPILDML